MNKCIFVGNLTRDPEAQTTPNGVSFCRFTIAVNRSYSNSNGEREADFINIVAWRGLADNCAKYLSKGRKVCVCGNLQTSRKKRGSYRYFGGSLWLKDNKNEFNDARFRVFTKNACGYATCWRGIRGYGSVSARFIL